MTSEHVRDAYAAIWRQYTDLFGTRELVDPADLAFIERHMSIQSGRVLDLGCGPGHLTAHLRSLGVDAAGIDLVPEFIAHAKAAHPDGEYSVGSLTDVDAQDGSVAGVLSWFSLIHFPPAELDAALAEVRRILAPGGTLVAGFCEGADVEPFDHKVATAWRWPADRFSEVLARAGFKEVDRLLRPGTDTQRPYGALATTRHG